MRWLLVALLMLAPMRLRSAEFAPAFIVGPITDRTAQTFHHALIAQEPSGEVKVIINSEGGSVSAGEAIAHLIETSPARVTCTVVGQASSMAFTILQSCDRRHMLVGSRLMTHEPFVVFEGPQVALDRRALAEAWMSLDATAERLARHNQRRLRVTLEEYNARVDRRDWEMNAAEAILYGAVDDVLIVPP